MKGANKMIFTLEKRKGKDHGSFTTWYELRQYSGVSRLGIMLDGETVKDFDTLKEAKDYCEKNGINYIKTQEPKGCKW